MKILMHYGDYASTPIRKQLNEYGGVGYYRIVKPAEHITDHEVTVVGAELLNYGKNAEEQWDNIFKKYDLVWTTYFTDGPAGATAIYHARKHKKKFVVDLDDNYLDVPESNLLHERFKKTKRDRVILTTILSLADAVTVSTEPLKARLEEEFKKEGIKTPIFVVPNMNDIKDWDFKPAEKYGDRIVIGYAGSNSHNDDLLMVMPAIKNIMERYPNVWLELMGTVDKETVRPILKGLNDDCLNRCALVAATNTFKEYRSWMSTMKWDIGIAPLVDTAFTRSKSHIKWMEYSMYKIPMVLSRTYPYFMELKGREVVEDEETGLLASPTEWEGKLTRLIEDVDLRKKLGENAYNFIKKEWQYRDFDFNQVVGEILE